MAELPTIAEVAPITVVGLIGGTPFGAAAERALGEADVLVGSARQLGLVAAQDRTSQDTIDLAGPLPLVLDRIAPERATGRRVCVLASGDPGFFGIVRTLAARFGSSALVVHPAPSSVSVAFARIGECWEDAVVVSAHGRPLAAAVQAALHQAKVAVLTSPENPPQRLGQALLAAGCGQRAVAVASRLGEANDSVTQMSLQELAERTFDPLSVVILRALGENAIGPNETSAAGSTLAWGLPETAFSHRDGMITKAEVRAVVLGKLDLPQQGVLWDVGAGSGSVGIEAARLAPRLRVIAIERVGQDAERIAANAAAHRVAVEVVLGEAPEAFAALADPDRVFVGGGGIAVLDAVLARLRPGGVVVASYAIMERAVQAARRLGNLVQINVSRGVETGDLGLRLVAENPVFITWSATTA